MRRLDRPPALAQLLMSKSGKSSVKLVVTLVVVVALASGAYYVIQGGESKKLEIGVTTVTRGDVVQIVTATGQLDPVLSVDVGSQISGLVLKLHADFNTLVKKDQVIAEIDPATYEQRLRQAEADLASTQASNSLQRINTERIRELFQKQLVSRQELDQAEALLAQSNAQLLTRQAALENAKVDLNRCTIRSPIDGIVISKQTEEGKTVAASLNSPTLFTIANDLAKMRITASVAEADIGQIAEGQDVTFTVDAFPTRNFGGRITQVRNAPKAQSNVVTYETIIDVDNQDRKLLPGMTANVSIIVARRNSVLRVANSALRVRIPEGFSFKPLSGREDRGDGEKNAPASPRPDSGNAGRERVASAGNLPSGGPPGGAGGGGNSRRGNGGGRRGGGGGANLTAEQILKMQQARAERGLGGEDQTFSRRTVYHLPGGDKAALPEAVQVTLGITDGFTTEVINGLNEADVLITSVSLAGQAATTSQGANNPFAPQRSFGGSSSGSSRRGF